MMLVLSVPAATTLSTSRSRSSAAITAGASSTAASRSMSPIVGRRRRSDPAASMRRTPRAWRSRSMMPPTSASASWISIRSYVRSIRAMPSRMFASARSERPFTRRRRPSSAAARSASTESMPSSTWSRRTVFGPTPGIFRMSSRPSGTSARSRS
jgi:hypothetical protein